MQFISKEQELNNMVQTKQKILENLAPIHKETSGGSDTRDPIFRRVLTTPERTSDAEKLDSITQRIRLNHLNRITDLKTTKTNQS